jgi:hypothetical protein
MLPAAWLLELKLKRIQAHMAQIPLLWVEVGAHAVRNKSKCGGVGWVGVGVAWRLGDHHWVCVLSLKQFEGAGQAYNT